MHPCQRGCCEGGPHMERFGPRLKKLLEESGISVNSFAKLINIDRSYLYRIFSGTKSIPEEKLHAVLNSELFSKKQREQLRSAFYTEKYGAAQYERILTILQELGSNPAADVPVLPYTGKTAFTPTETTIFSDRFSLCDAISAQLDAACRTGGDYLYTNFSGEQKEIDQAVYALLSRLPEPIRFIRMITLDTTGKTLHNIHAVFSAMKYLSLNYNILFRYCNTDGKSCTGGLYPYFIYCRSGLMLFDSPAEHGLWIPAERLNGSVEQIILKRTEECAPLAIFPDGIFDLKDQVANFSQLEDSTESLSYAPCIGPYLTAEMFRDIINPNLPNIEYIITSTLNHYRSVDFSRSIFSLDGLREFVETGIIEEFPQALVKGPLAPKFRIEIVQKMIDALHQNRAVMILDSSKVTMAKGYNIEFYHHDKTKLIFAATTRRQEPNDFLYNILIPISDPVFANDIFQARQYVLDNGFVYSEHYTEHLLEDMLTLARTQQKEAHAET